MGYTQLPTVRIDALSSEQAYDLKDSLSPLNASAIGKVKFVLRNVGTALGYVRANTSETITAIVVFGDEMPVNLGSYRMSVDRAQVPKVLALVGSDIYVTPLVKVR